MKLEQRDLVFGWVKRKVASLDEGRTVAFELRSHQGVEASSEAVGDKAKDRIADHERGQREVAHPRSRGGVIVAVEPGFVEGVPVVGIDSVAPLIKQRMSMSHDARSLRAARTDADEKGQHH